MSVSQLRIEQAARFNGRLTRLICKAWFGQRATASSAQRRVEHDIGVLLIGKMLRSRRAAPLPARCIQRRVVDVIAHDRRISARR